MSVSSSLLSPAPPPSTRPDAAIGDSRAPLVLVTGAITTALALVGVYALNRSGTNIMGWYADYVIPAGALIVGLVASSGYGIAGWRLHCKITGGLLRAVIVLTAAAYFAAQYLEYRLILDRLDAEAIGFWRYFDLTTRAFRWEEHGKVGSQLGALGYGLRALELVGFVGGGLIGPGILRARPYCDRCRRYKDRPLVAVLPAGVPPANLKSKRTATKGGWFERESEAQRQARSSLDAIFAAARGDSFAILSGLIGQHGPLAGRKSAEALSGFIAVRLVHCPRCSDGALAADLTTRRQNRPQVTKLGEVQLAPARVDEFVRCRKS
jgi:hypothetical protein